TNYFENVPASMLDYALFAESDRMGHLLGVLDQKKLDLQRGVVQNEKRQARGMGCETDRHAPWMGAGSRPSGSPLSCMERAGVRLSRRGAAGFGGTGTGSRQNLPPLQATGLQGSDCDHRDRE